MTSSDKDYFSVLFLAVLSKTLILILGKFSSILCQPFDKSSLIAKNNSIFNYLLSWDAVHFLEITQNGYTAEHLLAFFPLPSLIVRYVPLLNPLTTAVLLNITYFIISALILYKIGKILYGRRISYISTMFFIFDPASIIFCAFYTESLYCLLFLMGLYYVITKRIGRSSIFFGLSTLCRSNGIMNLIFLKTIYFPILILPLAIFQYYSLLLLARKTINFKPFFVYSYVQRKYWDQGFLRFIKIQNIPNMLFGLPFIIYVYYILKEYIKSRMYLIKSSEQKLSDKKLIMEKIAKFLLIEHGVFSSLKKFLGFIKDPFYINSTSPTSKCALILGLQLFTTIFFIHWNIFGRFIAYNPFIYWSTAVLAVDNYKTTKFRIITGFFIGYMIAYAILFSCFYPPA